MQETWDTLSISEKDPLEKEMATHSSILAGIIQCMEEPYIVYMVAESDMTEHACIPALWKI